LVSNGNAMCTCPENSSERCLWRAIHTQLRTSTQGKVTITSNATCSPSKLAAAASCLPFTYQTSKMASAMSLSGRTAAPVAQVQDRRVLAPVCSAVATPVPAAFNVASASGIARAPVPVRLSTIADFWLPSPLLHHHSPRSCFCTGCTQCQPAAISSARQNRAQCDMRCWQGGR
jgi:hypothetical protein